MNAVEEVVNQLLSRRTTIRFKRQMLTPVMSQEFPSFQRDSISGRISISLADVCVWCSDTWRGILFHPQDHTCDTKASSSKNDCLGHGRIPSSLRRGCFVICKVVVPYVIDHLSKQDILFHLFQNQPQPEDPLPDPDADSVVMKLGQFVLTSWNDLRSWCQRNSENIQYAS